MVNKVVLIGNVGQDPETKQVSGNVSFSKLTLATTKKWKTDGEPREETQWHNVVFWRGLSDVVGKYVHKGDKIYIEGEISYRTYEDDKGVKKFFTEIIASEMKMLGSKKSNDVSVEKKEEKEDLPF